MDRPSAGTRPEDQARPLIVISAVALVTGGPHTILRQAVADARRFEGANFRFLVHDASRWEPSDHVRFVQFPRARASYLRRVYAEYVQFPRLSRRWRPDVWLSLHDTTPPVTARRQAVYCHNPLPYWRPGFRDLWLQPVEVFRSLVYGIVYLAFAGRNDLVVGQLPWYTAFIGRYMGVPKPRWLVVEPRAEPGDDAPAAVGRSVLDEASHDPLECLYVSLPRVFKDFEEAIDLCDQPGVRLTVTISGDENRYARHVRAYARTRGEVAFAGHLSHADVRASMSDADVVLFPSRLETFGLPIQEAMALGTTLVLPVRPWTVEIAAGYERAHFYRSLDEGRAILRSLARGKTPEWSVRPSPPPTALPRLSGFAELYRFLLGSSSAGS